MSKQTPLQKAIDQLKANSIIEIRPDIYRDAINNTIKVLTDLLPYEREVIQNSYNQGDEDRYDTSLLKEVPKYNNSTNYFTKTFTENDNE